MRKKNKSLPKCAPGDAPGAKGEFPGREGELPSAPCFDPDTDSKVGGYEASEQRSSGLPELAEADQVRKPVEGESKLTKTLIILFGAAFAAALAGWLIPGNFFGSDSTDAFLFFCIPVIIYYFNLWRKSKKEEKEDARSWRR